MIIGTAGHIDHGKTSLVRALTGVDTDRLKEEKARGISIELGYAYMPVAAAEPVKRDGLSGSAQAGGSAPVDGSAPGGDDILGFIDVPGHERLIHTMVAGACGIDFALLVVAADDGVMPQTREHLAILELLGVARGAVALTKTDRVDDRRIQAVRAEIATLLAPTILNGAPIFPLNATAPDNPGTESLRRHLHETAAGFAVRHDKRLFRLAVDRVFTLSGHGTVVTGTVFSGAIRVGETVTVMPSGTEVRVRSIHAQNRPTDTGRAGQRCALNLAGIETSAISRGDWLADPRIFVPTTHIDVRLQLLVSDSAASLKPWAPLHVHLGTGHHVAHVVPLEATVATSVRVQLVFDSPICTIPGDRFIVRDAQAMRTVGGGVVLDPFAPHRKRKSPERLRWLEALENWIAGEGVAALLQAAPRGVKMTDLVRLTGLPQERICLPDTAVTIDAGQERFVLDSTHWGALRDRVVAALVSFHAQVPDEPGPDVGRLRRIALPELAPELWRALVDSLVQDRLVIRSGPWLHLPEHVVALSPEDQQLAQKLQPLIAAGRFDPPWVRDLATVSHEPEERVRAVLHKSVTQGAVFQVVRDLFYDRDCIGELAAVITRIATERGSVEAAHYRDVLGIGRKRVIQILEFFDRVGYTRRVKNTHVLRQGSGWRA